MAQSVSIETREGAPSVRYAKDRLIDAAIGVGILLVGGSIVLDQPGLAAVLTIIVLLLVVRHAV
jgi:hypothetical protein